MKNILVIAKNTFRQAIRDKILYGILVFALLFLGLTMVLGSLSLGEDEFVIKSFGLAGVYLFGVIITIFLGASIVYKEVEEKMTYLILSKPVTKNELIWGKFLGLLGAISATIILMALAYLAIIFLNTDQFDYQAIIAVGLRIFEISILIGLLIMFSMFTTPLATIIYTILILYIGHSLEFIKSFAEKTEGAVKIALLAVYYVFPNLEKFNVHNLVIHNAALSPTEILTSSIYALIYIVLALYLAKILLNNKEL